MSWQQLEVPPYDHLFSVVAKQIDDENKRWPKPILNFKRYFYSLHYFDGMKQDHNVQAFQRVIGELSESDPALCKFILEQEMPSAGMKMVATMCTKHGIALDLDRVFEALPVWTKRLQRMNVGREPERGRIASLETERGIMVEGQIESLYTQLIFSADTEQKQKALKSYFAKCSLSPADIQVLALHKQYQPSMRKMLKFSEIGSPSRDYETMLMGLAVSGNLDYERLDKAREKDDFKPYGVPITQLFDKRPGIIIDGYELGLSLTQGGSSYTSLRLLFVDVALSQYLSGLDKPELDVFAAKLLKALTDEHLSGMGSARLITRAITRAALLGATKPFENMVECMIKDQHETEIQKNPWLWAVKHGVFGESLSIAQSEVMTKTGQFGRDYLLANGVTLSVDENGCNILTHEAPQLEELPENLDQCLGHLIHKIVCSPYKSGQHLTPFIAQKMVDLDVLTPEQLGGISANEKAIKALCLAELPQGFLEKIPDQMREQVLGCDLGL